MGMLDAFSTTIHVPNISRGEQLIEALEVFNTLLPLTHWIIPFIALIICDWKDDGFVCLSLFLFYLVFTVQPKRAFWKV